MKIFDKFLGWGTTPVPHASDHAMAQALRHRNPHDGCLPWLQGKCPGLNQCLDCAWKEGTFRQQD